MFTKISREDFINPKIRGRVKSDFFPVALYWKVLA